MATYSVHATILGGIVATLLGTGPAPAAADHDRAAFAAFKRLDRSGDMALPVDALTRADVRLLFSILDNDDNGVLTAADGAAVRRLLHQARTQHLTPAQLRPSLLAALDQDGDGRLSLGELRPALSGNQPLAAAATLPRPAEIDHPTPPQPCWLPTSQGAWIQLPAWAPKCRLR